ncbi:MAG TPA: transglutaminase-like cysteine peptidase [Gammaproteobacteria bacterium]|nr:transglutaminase-like cysteine peptidase [Gammaproteobacteria bacterium]
MAHRILLVLLAASALFCAAAPAASHPNTLFGYHGTRQDNIKLFHQWVDVLARHIRDDVPEGDCNAPTLTTCHLRKWFAFLKGIRHLPPLEQIRRVNRYANRKQYVLDIDNYGVEDYWADAKEFLYNGGDCEDYAITKLFSLRWLGFPPSALRLVVLQDTNLKVPHAVLAVYIDGKVLILDNQTQQVVPDTRIVHYVPVYAINENHWWIYTPTS